MTMQRRILRFVAASVAVLASSPVDMGAQEIQPQAVFVEGRITNGFFIGITDEYGKTNSSADGKLNFSIWSTNQNWTNILARVVIPEEPEYAYQAYLYDTNGIAVDKTDAGKKVGVKFQDFNAKSFYIRSSGPPVKEGVRSQAIIPRSKSSPYEMLALFRPADLFEIKHSGRYTLRIYFQFLAFRRAGTTSGGFTNVLIRPPPIDYPIIQN